MSTALDFTVDIGSLPTRDQGPKKMQAGGATKMFINKPQERTFQTPERVKSDQMLAEAPPTSLENIMESQAPQTFVNKPQERVFQIQPPRPMIDPQLQQILQAQNDMSGIMMANRQPKKGIEFLMERTYTI
tara:strand:+ start:2395 stop:2787 length:393 start_codon:yes stop_codon:yes gene_type:complete